MFENGYTFRCSGAKSEGVTRKLIYTFVTDENHKYITELEEHPMDVYVVKFYLKNHCDSDKKYSLTVSNSHRSVTSAQRVLKTCADICQDLARKNPKASFALIAAPKDGEEKYFNTRYRIYKQIIADWFSSDEFLHIHSEPNSGYLLINKSNNDPIDVAEKTIERFANVYPELFEDGPQDDSDIQNASTVG